MTGPAGPIGGMGLQVMPADVSLWTYYQQRWQAIQLAQIADPLLGGIAFLAATQTFSGVNTFSNATDATALGTGALVLSAGGLSVNNQVQIGTNLTVGGLIVQSDTVTNPGATVKFINVLNTVALTGTNAQVCENNFGLQTSANSQNYTSFSALRAVQGQLTFQGTGTVSGAFCFGTSITGSAAQTVSQIYSYYAAPISNAGGASFTTTAQFYADSLGFGTTRYGYYCAAQSGGTSNYAFYSAGAGLVQISDTTSATTSLLGAVVIGNGTASTSVGIGGGNINAGGSLTVGGTSTFNSNITLSGAGVTETINATSGSAVLRFQNAGTSTVSLSSGPGSSLLVNDLANSATALQYVAGALSALYWIFPGTLSASASNAGAVLIGTTGTAATCVAIGGGNINAGATITGIGLAATTGGVTVTGGNISISNSGSAGVNVGSSTSSSSLTLNPASGFGAFVVGQQGGGNIARFGVSSSTLAFVLQDMANGNWNVFAYTAGATSAGYVTFAGTLSASTSLVGAVVVGNGTAATSIGLGGGNINAGSSIIAGTSISASNGTVNSTNSAAPGFSLTLGSTLVSQVSANSTYAMTLFDQVNSWGFLRYTAGAISAGTVQFQGTLSASSSIVGAVLVGNGTAATSIGLGAGNIWAGSAITAGSDTGSNGLVTINGAAGTNRQFIFSTASSARWIWKVDSTAESGSNAGSNFSILARSDTGTAIDTPFSVSRAAGSAIILGGSGTLRPVYSVGGLGWGVTSTATAAGTTTLTATTTAIQIFTGSTTQTIQFPAANVFGAGVGYMVIICNESTGSVTSTRAGSDTFFPGGATTDVVATNTVVRYVSDGVSKWIKY